MKATAREAARLGERRGRASPCRRASSRRTLALLLQRGLEHAVRRDPQLVDAVDDEARARSGPRGLLVPGEVAAHVLVVALRRHMRVAAAARGLRARLSAISSRIQHRRLGVRPAASARRRRDRRSANDDLDAAVARFGTPLAVGTAGSRLPREIASMLSAGIPRRISSDLDDVRAPLRERVVDTGRFRWRPRGRRRRCRARGASRSR